MSAYDEAYHNTAPKLKKPDVIKTKAEAVKAFNILEEYRGKRVTNLQEYYRYTGGTRAGLRALGKADAHAEAAQAWSNALKKWFEHE